MDNTVINMIKIMSNQALQECMSYLIYLILKGITGGGCVVLICAIVFCGQTLGNIQSNKTTVTLL